MQKEKMEKRFVFRSFCSLATVLGIVGLSGSADAMTQVRVDMICPYDGTKFSATIEVSGYASDTTLDLKPVGAIQSPWPLAICPTNGFVFFKPKFTDEELEKLKPFVFSDEYKAMQNESPYYRAAWLNEHLGAKHSEVTWMLTEATWERPAYAAKVAERMPQDIAEAADDDTRINGNLLYGDLLRQIKRFPEAEQVFSGVLEKVGRYTHRGLLARYELDLIKAGDASNEHLQSEAEKHFENDADFKQASRIPAVSNAGPLKQVLAAEPIGLDFRQAQLKRLVWSDDASTIFANTKDGIVAIDAASGKQSTSPGTFCKNCTAGATQILLSTSNAVYVIAANPTGPDALKSLDTRTLAETASSDIRFFHAPALLSFDKKAMLLEEGIAGTESRNLQTNESRKLELPPNPNPDKPYSRFLKASDPTGPRFALYLGGLTDKSRIVIWDYSTGTKTLELDPGSVGDLERTAEAAYTQDGKRLYVAADLRKTSAGKGAQCELGVWDTQSGQLASSQLQSGTSARLAQSPDGRYAAMACGQSLSIWSADLKQEIATMTITGKGWFPSIAFSPDSKKLAVHTGEAVVVYAVGQ